MMYPLTMSEEDCERASDEDIIAARMTDGRTRGAAEYMLPVIRGTVDPTHTID
ncbi:hypothetical protein HMPREF0063_11508 [Aeromicrobium marinum DSM 15272]|uniref:Uncharacterized protein n=1 Tax=Aeromicrobium marinum DSM 15272 TaxID=585531 RepID=E2SBU9_9ACTN|nr:hypothetical protein [Aeromicrobium marinum]EFQ83235.1 hypothetical protein HMPREF0063_11508 [Aeromicrobium marinum DSM 15272]